MILMPKVPSKKEKMETRVLKRKRRSDQDQKIERIQSSLLKEMMKVKKVLWKLKWPTLNQSKKLRRIMLYRMMLLTKKDLLV
jgi:hypothetical protein